jgi:hypothetical protein
MTEREERLEQALQSIVSWSEAYPLKIFPEPDLKKARVLLQAGGITLDAVSAHCMRHVVEGVGKIAKEALATTVPQASGVREAVIEECARACEARIRGKDGLEGGNDWGHNAPYNAEDKACAAAIRALAVTRPNRGSDQ